MPEVLNILMKTKKSSFIFQEELSWENFWSTQSSHPWKTPESQLIFQHIC